jgi:lysophospholipase L1-like esterase
MAIGDSITDDCSISGAWRRYLQPLLETNGYPFVFVGRYASTPTTPSFTKVYHEGHCGAVIAPPGAFAVHGYTTTDAYLLKIVADALAITNNRPDLVLLKIGVNDIGRGRDPYLVATNHMPALLNLIFSNAPNANIVLSKITSIQTGAFSYNTYAANVLVYNAALQAMVNQRRAAGQNVFLADMFSAVDYNTMFQGDHVHPNALGLASMAREWLVRIQAITRRTDQVTRTLIRGGEVWKFNDQGQDLGTNWAQVDYGDSGWSNGLARLGYGDAAAATMLSYGSDPANRYPATYFRRWFEVPLDMIVTNLNFRLSRACGAVVWLNGRELFRTNMAAGTITYTNLALGALNPYMAHVYHQTNLAAAGLSAGTNLVAVELHQSSASFSLHSFDMELIASGYPPPSLSIVPAGTNVVVSWPLTNAEGFKLYSTTNLGMARSWTLAMALVQTNGGTVTVTQAPDAITKFFRLQKQ